MDRQIIEISNNGFFLSLYRGFLVIENEKKQKQEIPLDNILSLILSADNTVISKNIVNAVIEQGGNIIFCDKKYLPSTIAVPYTGHWLTSHRIKQQIDCSRPLQKNLWKSIVQHNYAYTILRAMVARAVSGNGLLPYLGLKHCGKTNSLPLVDDLIEPFRAIADKLVFDEVNKIINTDNIELNAEIKRNLAKLIVFPAITGKGAVTLSAAIYDFVGSLVSSFEDKKVLLKYPQYEL